MNFDDFNKNAIELINDQRKTICYSYDNIGNRITAQENDINLSYATNQNNQSKIQSSTGEWLVSYNANNRPISFTRVECNYDYMGRQYLRKVYKSGSSSPTTNERYIHRGYLRLGALNMNNGVDFYQALLWDPTEPQATRPLALLNNDGTYYYGHDFNKNVTELFNANGDIVNHYDYRPYGALLQSQENIPNPIQYSSEVYDPELGLISYHYHHYNPEDGRWLTPDPIQEDGGLNLYGFVGNNPMSGIDLLGLLLRPELQQIVDLAILYGVGIQHDTHLQTNCLGYALDCDTPRGADYDDAVKQLRQNCEEVSIGPCEKNYKEVILYGASNDKNFYHVVLRSDGKQGWSAVMGGLGLITNIPSPDIHTEAAYMKAPISLIYNYLKSEGLTDQEINLEITQIQKDPSKLIPIKVLDDKKRKRFCCCKK